MMHTLVHGLLMIAYAGMNDAHTSTWIVNDCISMNDAHTSTWIVNDCISNLLSHLKHTADN